MVDFDVSCCPIVSLQKIRKIPILSPYSAKSIKVVDDDTYYHDNSEYDNGKNYEGNKYF